MNINLYLSNVANDDRNTVYKEAMDTIKTIREDSVTRR